MLRIKENVLDKKNGKYYYNNKLFDGIIYFVNECKITARKVVQSGDIIKDYIDPYLDYSLWELHIDEECIEFSDLPVDTHYLNDELFTGVGYEFFKNGLYCAEMTYRKGRSIRDDYYEPIDNVPLVYIEYYQNGQMHYFEYHEKDFFQEYEMFEDGNIAYIYFSHSLYQKKELSVGYQKMYSLEMRLDSVYSLRNLSIKGDYFQNIQTVQAKSKFDAITSKDFLKDISASKNFLTLHHKGIDDEIFYYLHLNNGLDKLRHLSVFDTSLTDKSFKLLRNLMNLQKLKIESNECSSTLLQEIKEYNPLCEITYNQETM